MHIRAAVLREHSAPHAIEDVELADPTPGQVLVRIAGSGLCHTDLLPRDPGFLATPPIITGHEGSGVVEATGCAVFDIRVGDHVVLSYDCCHRCENCRSGQPAYCFDFFARNLSGQADGSPGPITDLTGAPIHSRWFGQSSFATHTVVDARNVTVVDPALPIELLGPLGCGIQTGAGAVLNALRTPPGSAFAVFGAGAVGLSAVMAAKAVGAGRIIAVDVNPHRLEAAVSFGATDVIPAAGRRIPGQIRKLSEGGVHTALDTTGSPEAIAVAVDSLRPTGCLGMVGTGRGNLVLTPSALARGKQIKGILEGDAVPQVFLPRLIDMWSRGMFPFDQLIQTFPLDDINTAIDAASSGTVIKPVLLPWPAGGPKSTN